MAVLTAVAADNPARPVLPPTSPAEPIDLHALYTAHWRYLVRLAVLLVDDVASAEDVVQDAFVALHRRSGSLREPDAALAYLRASVRQPVALGAAPAPGRPQALAGRRARSDRRRRFRRAAARRAPGRARRGARRCPGISARCSILRYWSGLSEREIAAALGISPGSVKSAASRGLAALQRVLGR